MLKAKSMFLLLLLLALPLQSCHVTTFRVGMGGNGIGQETAHQYYLFFGLFRLNEVDVQRVIDQKYTGYDVEVGFAYRDTFVDTMTDLFISSLFLPLTVTRQAVTVKW